MSLVQKGAHGGENVDGTGGCVNERAWKAIGMGVLMWLFAPGSVLNRFKMEVVRSVP